MQGKMIKVLSDKKQDAGFYTMQWDNSGLAKDTYVVTAFKHGINKQVIKVVKN